MLSSHPQIFMPEVKEPWFFARELRPRSERRRARDSRPNTLEQYLVAVRRRGAGQLVGEASPQYIRSQTARWRRSPRCGRTRGSSRSCASRRASCARCTCSWWRRTSSPSGTSRRAIALEPRQARGQAASRGARSRRSRCSTPITCATPSSCAGCTMRSRRAGAGADLRRLPPRQRGDGASGAARSSASTRLARSRRSRRSRSNAVRSMRLHQLRRAIRRARLNPAAGRPAAARATTRSRRSQCAASAIAASLRRAAYEPQRAGRRRARRSSCAAASSPRSSRRATTSVAISSTLWGYDRIS